MGEDELFLQGYGGETKGLVEYLLDANETVAKLDAVGGTVVLVRAGLHREGLVFPSYPVGNMIETEGLAQVAIRMGTQPWGMPNLRVRHA